MKRSVSWKKLLTVVGSLLRWFFGPESGQDRAAIWIRYSYCIMRPMPSASSPDQ